MKNPKINIYLCEYNCHTVTVDVDKGVTPFMIKCRAKSRPDRPLKPALTGKDGECIGNAKSCFYPKGPKPPHIQEPTHEWRIPTESELKKIVEEGLLNGVSKSQTMDYFKNGALALFPRSEREPVYHE